MRYRIDQSRSRPGFARVHMPGRVLSLEARDHDGALWQVSLTDLFDESTGSIAVRAGNANDAVWRVARAAVRAVSQLTGNPIEGELAPAAPPLPADPF